MRLACRAQMYTGSTDNRWLRLGGWSDVVMQDLVQRTDGGGGINIANGGGDLTDIFTQLAHGRHGGDMPMNRCGYFVNGAVKFLRCGMNPRQLRKGLAELSL